MIDQAGASQAPGQPAAAASAHTVLLEWVEAQLLDGSLRPGDRLPPERALAQRFELSRSSVREALQILGVMGLVRSGVGSGPRAGTVVTAEPSAALSWALRLHIATRALPMADVVATRVLLETQSMLGARVASAEDRREILDRAGGLLQQMEAPCLPDAVFDDLDIEFHVVLSELGGNSVATTVLSSLRATVVGYVSQGIQGISAWPQLRARLIREHGGILAAVERGDHPLAARLLERHIRDFETSVLPGG